MIPRFVMVLKSGKLYGPEYAERLASAIRRWSPPDVEIVCLSDLTGMTMPTIPLQHDLPGWWSKMELFREGLFDDGRPNIYLDLDTLICGSLLPLLSYEGNLAVLADLYRPERMIGSAVVLWRGDAMGEAWKEFSFDPKGTMERHQTRMDYFLAQWLLSGERVQTLWPGLAVSYKRACRKRGGPPEGTSLICFHGNPRPRDLPPGDWARKLWMGEEEL